MFLMNVYIAVYSVPNVLFSFTQKVLIAHVAFKNLTSLLAGAQSNARPAPERRGGRRKTRAHFRNGVRNNHCLSGRIAQTLVEIRRKECLYTSPLLGDTEAHS